MMHSTPMIATGAERSVAELRLIFERCHSPVDMRLPIETVQVQEPVVVVVVVPAEPELEIESALELKNQHEIEPEVAAEAAIKNERELEDVPVLSYERKSPSFVDDGAAARDDQRSEGQAPQDPVRTSETGIESGLNVAVAPMPRQDSNALKARSLIRPPQVTRSASRRASAPLQVNTSIVSRPIAAPGARETPRGTTRHAKSNEQELARAKQWRENKKALDSRVAAAKPRYMDYTTSSSYIANREASVAQRQQSTRTNGSTRATTTRRS